FLEMIQLLEKNKNDWFVREVIGYLRRTLSRLDVSSRSMFALIEPGSCFAGTHLEIALAADRSYMLDAEGGPKIALSPLNFGTYPMANGLSRIETHFCGEVPSVPRNEMLDSGRAGKLGLVTSTPDESDWDVEVPSAPEHGASLTPDAVTG